VVTRTKKTKLLFNDISCQTVKHDNVISPLIIRWGDTSNNYTSQWKIKKSRRLRNIYSYYYSQGNSRTVSIILVVWAWDRGNTVSSVDSSFDIQTEYYRAVDLIIALACMHCSNSWLSDAKWSVCQWQLAAVSDISSSESTGSNLSQCTVHTVSTSFNYSCLIKRMPITCSAKHYVKDALLPWKQAIFGHPSKLDP
jgi:hypothetical protein